MTAIIFVWEYNMMIHGCLLHSFLTIFKIFLRGEKGEHFLMVFIIKHPIFVTLNFIYNNRHIIIHILTHLLIPFPFSCRLSSSSQLTLLCNQAARIIRRVEMLPRNLRHVLKARDIHQDIEVCKQALHDVAHANLAFDAETPHPEAADEDEFRAEGERFEDVCGRADAGVEHYGGLVAHRFSGLSVHNAGN